MSVRAGVAVGLALSALAFGAGRVSVTQSASIAVGGPGGGGTVGGRVIVNVPKDVRVLTVYTGAPGGCGTKGGNAPAMINEVLP